MSVRKNQEEPINGVGDSQQPCTTPHEAPNETCLWSYERISKVDHRVSFLTFDGLHFEISHILLSYRLS